MHFLIDKKKKPQMPQIKSFTFVLCEESLVCDSNISAASWTALMKFYYYCLTLSSVELCYISFGLVFLNLEWKETSIFNQT